MKIKNSANEAANQIDRISDSRAFGDTMRSAANSAGIALRELDMAARYEARFGKEVHEFARWLLDYAGMEVPAAEAAVVIIPDTSHKDTP